MIIMQQTILLLLFLGCSCTTLMQLQFHFHFPIDVRRLATLRTPFVRRLDHFVQIDGLVLLRLLLGYVF